MYWVNFHHRTAKVIIYMKLMAKKKTNNKTISFSPESEEQTDLIIGVIKHINPIIGLFLDVQRFTGLRYSDCSRITYENIAKSPTQIRSQFTIVQKKIYSGAITRFKNNDKYKNHSEQELHDLAIDKASLRVFIGDKLKNLFLEVLELQKGNSKFNFKNKEALIFTSFHHHSNGKAITKEGINQLLKSEKVGRELAKHDISNENLGTHSFRKDFGQRLLEKKANVIDIQELLGQSSLDSTIRYLSTSDKKKKDLVNAIADRNASHGAADLSLEQVNQDPVNSHNDRVYALVEKAIENGAPETVINNLLSKLQ